MALTIKMRIDEQPEHSYVFSTGDGGQIELIPLSVVQNGSYTAPDGKAYNIVTVEVPETELVHLNITENGTYTAVDGTAYDVVTVNVQPILEAVSRSYTENGTYTIVPSEQYDGISDVAVNIAVQNTYTQGDEGKVVSNGALVSQTAHADVTPTTSDQTINTTLNNSIKVKGDADLVAGNIKKNVEIFGVTGTYEGGGGGVSNVDYGDFDAGMLTQGSSNVLFQFRTNETPLAFYIFSDDPMVASVPSGESLISFNGIANQNAGIPYDFYVGQSYFDGSMGNFNAYANDSDLSQVTVDGGMADNVIGCDTNNNVIGFVMDTINPMGYGLVGIYHYVVIYPNK